MTTTRSSGLRGARLTRRRTAITLIAVVAVLLGLTTTANAAKQLRISSVTASDVT